MKAIIIDDEYIVLEGMKKMIDWSSYGIEIVGTADNGEDGMKLFNQYQPTIVFTDIRMPGKDGLELVRDILEKAPDTLCVVFSGFNEFDYVRNALKLGVIDYLEKPITIPMIKDTIDKIMEEIKQKQEFTLLKESATQNNELRLEKITMDLLLQNAGSLEKWQNELKEYSHATNGFVVIMHDLESLTINEKSQEYLPIDLNIGINHIIVLYLYAKEPTTLLDELSDKIEDNKIIALGNIYTEAADLRKSYEEALKAYKYNVFRNKKGIVLYENMKRDSTLAKEISKEEKEILYNIKLGDQQLVYEALNKYFDTLEEQQLDAELLEEALLKLFYLCLDAMEEESDSLYDSNKLLPQIELQHIKTKSELKSWISSKLDWVISSSEYYQRSRNHPLILKACQYIHRYYNQNISLQEVADEIGLNPNYFSALFKEVMEVTYIKYLTLLRIEMAKLMLRHGETVQKVSESVGYATYRHFSDTFKKYMNTSPGKYKEDMSI